MEQSSHNLKNASLDANAPDQMRVVVNNQVMLFHTDIYRLSVGQRFGIFLLGVKIGEGGTRTEIIHIGLN